VDQLLVALDLDSAAEAHAMADGLRGAVGGFKVNVHLFTQEGPAFVKALVERGDRVFLDLKFHDIPNTVASAVRAAARLGVWMLNVHASGGRSMLEAARRAADQSAEDHGHRPLVIAVTVLTSLNELALGEVGIPAHPDAQAERLAALAQDAGLDGVVASPLEARRIRERCGPEFLIVTPGIRGAADRADDQARTLSAVSASVGSAPGGPCDRGQSWDSEIAASGRRNQAGSTAHGKSIRGTRPT
jgi:orotidine-5'-phosphate decarboxylase